MTRIVSVEVEGLAGREAAVKYELDAGVNIFWGLNGSGKTSLLRILHFALDNDAVSVARVPFTRATVSIYSHADDRIIVRSLDKSTLLSHEELRRASDRLDEFAWQRAVVEREFLRARLRWKTTPKSKTQRYRHRYLPLSRFAGISASYDDGRLQSPAPLTRIDDTQIDELFASQIDGIWQEYRANALDKIRAIQQAGIASILRRVVRPSARRKESSPDVSPGEAFRAVELFLRGQDIRAPLGTVETFTGRFQNEPLLRDVISDIVDVQRQIEEAQRPQRTIEELLDDLFLNKRVALDTERIEVKPSRGSEDIPLSLLSSGEKQILRLLVECVAAEINSMLVDEPELSLHVDWQHRLVDCLRSVNPDSQLILATHSPEVMALVSDAHIFEL